MKPELHKEEVLFKKLFEILHVLKNRDKIALLFSYIDSNNVLQTYGSEMVKSKFEDLYKNSKSWPAAFKSDQRLLAATNVTVTDEASKAARTDHQQESFPALLPAPLSSMTIDELMDYVTAEIKREFTKKTGETQFKLLLKNPIYEPFWWPSELWDWSEVKKALKNQKYTGQGNKKDFLIATVKNCLDNYNLKVDEHVIPTYNHKSHVTKMKLKGQNVPPRAEFTSPAASVNGDSSSDSEDFFGFRVLRSMTASASSVSVTTIPTQLATTASGSQVTADMSTQSVPSFPSLVSVASSQASLQTNVVSVCSVPSLQNSLVSVASGQAGLSRQVSSVPNPQTNIVSVPSGQAGLKNSLASAPTPSVPSLQASLLSVPSGQASLVSVPSGQASLLSVVSGQAGLETSLASAPTPSVTSLLSVPSGQTSHDSLPSIPSLQTSLVASGQACLSGKVSTPCLQPLEADMPSVRSNISNQASHTPIPGHSSHQNSIHSHQQPHATDMSTESGLSTNRVSTSRTDSAFSKSMTVAEQKEASDHDNSIPSTSFRHSSPLLDTSIPAPDLSIKPIDKLNDSLERDKHLSAQQSLEESLSFNTIFRHQPQKNNLDDTQEGQLSQQRVPITSSRKRPRRQTPEELNLRQDSIDQGSRVTGSLNPPLSTPPRVTPPPSSPRVTPPPPSPPAAPKPAKRRRRGDEIIPSPSKIPPSSNTFKKQHLSNGIKNESTTCAINAVTFAAHRTGVVGHLVDNHNMIDSTSRSEDTAIIVYKQILEALPNSSAFSASKFITSWNNSPASYDRPQIGCNDDIMLADSIFSALSNYLDSESHDFFTKYQAKFQCVYCDKKVTLDSFEKAFELIPLLSPSVNGRAISPGQLFTEFLNEKFRVKCPSPCYAVNEAKIAPKKGKYTLLAMNRRNMTDKDGCMIPKVKTRVNDVRGHTLGDKFLGELVAVVTHKGDIGNGHWMTYSKIDTDGTWFVNSDRLIPKQAAPPMRSSKQNETADLLVYRNS